MGEEGYPEDYPLPDSLIGRKVGFRVDKAARELKTHMQRHPGIDMYPGAGKTARAYNYGVQSDAIRAAKQLKPTTYAHTDHIHADIYPGQGAGKFFIAPLETDPVDWSGWTELGFTTEGASFTAEFDMSSWSKDKLSAIFGGSVSSKTQTDEHTTELGKAKTMLGNEYATADQLEEAALNLAARAAAVRAFDATEPTGDEPTISFTHTYNDQPGGYGTNRDRKAYTFVGFKCNGEGGTDQWYLTGPKAQGRGYTWRELGATYPAIATGDFLVVTKWGAGK